MKALVIGKPVSHSLSPAIFSLIAQEEGKDLEYGTYEVLPENGEDFINQSFKGHQYVGFNVTLPLKETLLPVVDKLSKEVKSIGALNVIHFCPDGINGHNTDVIGIHKTILRSGLQFEGKDCLLWGAGGSARAVSYVLGSMKVRRIYIINRGPRGAELAKHFASIFHQTEFIPTGNLEDLKDIEFSIMVNSTPLGMQGKESGKDYFEKAKNLKFITGALAFDLIYVPEETDFIKTAKELNLKTVGGLGMLIDQALATWEIWFGPIKDEEELHNKLSTYLRGILQLRYHPAPIYLCGFMGVGKSTIGRRLAKLTGREFLDIDQEIEKSSGQSISDIFKKFGEAKFREMEKEMVKQLATKKDVVISLGGGSLRDQNSLDLVLGSGKLIYLEGSPEVLHKRISAQGIERPLLDQLPETEKLKKITDLLEERIEIYQKAPIKILTDSMSEEKICHEIILKIEGK